MYLSPLVIFYYVIYSKELVISGYIYFAITSNTFAVSINIHIQKVHEPKSIYCRNLIIAFHLLGRIQYMSLDNDVRHLMFPLV